mgnify:CR=1 FL=1
MGREIGADECGGLRLDDQGGAVKMVAGCENPAIMDFRLAPFTGDIAQDAPLPGRLRRLFHAGFGVRLQRGRLGGDLKRPVQGG